MKLSDQVIAEISRLLQVALLTGTDVVDNLRLIEVEIDEDYTENIILTDDYVNRSTRNIENMVEQASVLSSDNG